MKTSLYVKIMRNCWNFNGVKENSIAMFTSYVRLVGIVPKFDQYSKVKTEA